MKTLLVVTMPLVKREPHVQVDLMEHKTMDISIDGIVLAVVVWVWGWDVKMAGKLIMIVLRRICARPTLVQYVQRAPGLKLPFETHQLMTWY